MNISTLTAHHSNLFEIDAKLKATFDQMQEEREITGDISDESRERCAQLFAELGKKIDRIAAYLRTQQRKASIAAEEAQRLQQRRRSAEQRVDDVKQMLTYFMRCRGLKRLEGKLNTIRLQTNSQPSLQIDGWELPQEFCLHTGSIPHRLLNEMLEHLPHGLKAEFLEAMLNTQPNTQLVRDALLHVLLKISTRSRPQKRLADKPSNWNLRPTQAVARIGGTIYNSRPPRFYSIVATKPGTLMRSLESRYDRGRPIASACSSKVCITAGGSMSCRS